MFASVESEPVVVVTRKPVIGESGGVPHAAVSCSSHPQLAETIANAIEMAQIAADANALGRRSKLGMDRGYHASVLSCIAVAESDDRAKPKPPKAKPKQASPMAVRTLRLDEESKLKDDLIQALKESHRPVLVVLSGNEMGTRYRVERTISIGRDPTSELTLTDAGVSWQHARIEDRGDSWTLVDLGSTNGTTVNGQSIKSERVLSPNDKIVFGRTVVRFEVQDAVDQAYDEVVQRLLHIDDLSGLYVRRRFDGELASLLEAAKAGHHSVGMLVMDLDGVKGINDTHGHLFGAYVIGEAGRVIGRVLAKRGIAARFGGDEYIAAISPATAEETVAVGEEIRAAVASHRFEREGQVLKPGISIGVATYPDDAREARTLFQRADEALYRAKQAGKNRVSR